MESSISVDLRVNRSDIDFVLNLLQALKKKEMVEYKIKAPGPNSIALEGPALTVEELNDIIEEAEKGKKYNYEEFRAKYQL